MEGWPRIPNPGGGSGKAPRTTGTSLPAPGSTVVANVEDELGDGMYSLRWAGQKIHVASRSPLAKGQALLLKSETSPEGKPRLVVLDPAPEQAAPSGRIIYGPNIGKKPSPEQLLNQQAAAQQQARSAGLSHSRIGGNIVDTNSRAGQPDAGAPAGQAGGQITAGAAKAVTARARDPAPGLIGLVLEPLPEFERSAKHLLEAAEEEKGQLEEQRADENSADGAKKNRRDLLRPAVPEQAGRPGQTGQGGKPGATAGQPQQGGTGAPGQPTAQAQQPAAPAQTGSTPSAQPNSPTPQPGGTVQAQIPRAGDVRPAPAVVQDGGPAVPELPDASSAAPGGKTDPPQQPPAASGTPPQAQPNSPAANAPGQPAAPAGQPAVLPGQPTGQPAAPNAPAPPSAPGASQSAGTPPAAAQPNAPGTSAPVPAPLPGMPSQAPGTPVPQAPAAPEQPPVTPPAPGTGQPVSPSGQQPAASGTEQPAVPGQPVVSPGQSGGQTTPPPTLLPGTPGTASQQPGMPGASFPAPGTSAPQPLPGTPVLEGGGPAVPDVPADDGASQPQTRPAAPNTPAPPSAPGASQSAGTPPAAAPLPGTPPQPAAPGTPAPQGQPPATPGQPVVSPGQSGGQAAQPLVTLPGTPGAPAPQPLPGVPVLEGGGSAIPDVPVGGGASRPQTRPAAPNVPAPPAAPGASQPAGTPPAAVPPNASGTTPPAPAPLPGMPTPQPEAPGTPVPQTPAPSPAPAYPGAYPRPGTATYPRPTPQQNYAHAVVDHTASASGGAVSANGADGGGSVSSAPSPQIKPEMLLREALGQMVGAAEIPLGNPAADAARLAPGNKMPGAVLDKAAAILLRGAGLTPDPETMEAAKALVAHNVPVDRDSVQALLAAAAGIEDAGERDAALRASARLLSKDIPLAPPLIAGLSDVMARRATAHQLMDAAMQALAPDAALSMTAPEAEPLMAGARELLDMLHVDLGRADAPAALERALSTFGREALGQALALVETSAQAVLENNPQLQRIDQALTAVLSRLQPEMEQTAPPPAQAMLPAAPPPQAPAQPSPAVPQADIAELLPSAAAPEQTPPAQQPAQPAEQPRTPAPASPQSPPPVHPGRPINAYLNAPKALPIEEMLKKLPPMPKVVSLGTPPAAIPPMMLPGNIATMANLANLANAAAGAQDSVPALPPSTAQQILAQTLPQILPQMRGAQPQIPPSQAGAGLPPPGADASGSGAAVETPEPLDPEQIFRRAEALRRQSGVMNKLGSLFQIPGLNRQELELLRPGGFLDSFLGGGADRPDAAQVKADAEKLLRELVSDNPRTAERALRELPQRDSAVLRETAARLTRMESDAVRADPLMNKLSDAATSLRDLGRQLLAVKAENLALQDRNPGVMLAEVPFKLNNDAGDGRMQMFYRRGKKKGDGWSSRVILDLNTTRMGPVLGDMRFFGQDMTLNMFVDKQAAADYLSASAEELAENLSAKGFRVKIKFMVLPPPPPPPALDGERPVIAGEETAGQEEPRSTGARRIPGRLDIEL